MNYYRHLLTLMVVCLCLASTRSLANNAPEIPVEVMPMDDFTYKKVGKKNPKLNDKLKENFIRSRFQELTPFNTKNKQFVLDQLDLMFHKGNLKQFVGIKK